MQKALAAASPATSTPPEIVDAQRKARRLIKTIRTSWPPTGDSYRADIAFALLDHARGALTPMERRVSEFFYDDRSEETPETKIKAEVFLGFLGRASDFLASMERKIQAAVAPQIGPAAKPSQVIVLLPEFREQLVNILGYAIQSWEQLNRAHDVYLLWLDARHAEDITAALRAFLEAEWQLPGAKKPLHWGWKVGLGVVAAGAAGTGGYLLWRRYQRSRPLRDADPEEIPTGIHTFEVDEDSGDVRVMDAEFEEIDGAMVGTAETSDGEFVRIAGDSEDRDTLRQISRFVGKVSSI